MKIITLYWDDDSVDLSAFPPDTPVNITKPDGTSPVTGGKILTDPFRIAQLPVPNHEHPVIGIAGSPQPPVDGNE